MKTTFLTIYALIFLGTTTYAQNYYTTDTVKATNTVFKRDLKDNLSITLYNINNKHVYTKETYSDGRPTDPAVVHSRKFRRIEVAVWQSNAAQAIVLEAFTKEEKDAIRGTVSPFAVVLVIDPQTGKIIEVYFEFITSGSFLKVSPDTFYKIEQQLKEKISYTITPDGKTLNLIKCVYRYHMDELLPKN